MKIQHKCDNYSNLCDNNVTCKLSCLPKSIQLRRASLLHKCASSIRQRVCGVAWGDFSTPDFAKPPTAVYGETAFSEDLPRRRDLAIKRVVPSPQRARKHESKAVLEKYYFALPG